MAVPEIRIEARARNNRLIKLREEVGLTQHEAASRIGLHQASLGKLENLKDSPLRKGKDQLREAATRIAEYYGVSAAYIWPEAIRNMTASNIVCEVSAEHALQWDSWEQQQPELGQEAAERQQVVVDVLNDTLTEQQRDVIVKRFGLSGNQPMSLEGVAKGYGVTKERIRQIETKAIVKLRHPKRSRPLRELEE